jgi:drug/metabolite transporter (DMT)-like permease
MKTPSAALGGVALAIAAVACFAAYDTSTKVVSAGVPLVVALWVRYLFQMLFVARSSASSTGRAHWRTRHRALHVLRALCLLMSNVFSFLSFMHLPVAEVTAILMLTPLLITLVASVSMGERVRWRQWALIGAGFLGAVLIVRPGGSSVDWRMLLPVGLLFSNTAFQTLTSKLAKTESPMTVFAYTSSIGMLALSALLPVFWAGLPSLWFCFVLLLMAVFSTAGHHLLVLAYGRAPASQVTPFLYFQLIFAALGGWLVFDQIPDLWAWLGIALIAFSGVSGRLVAHRPIQVAAAARPAKA